MIALLINFLMRSLQIKLQICDYRIPIPAINMCRCALTNKVYGNCCYSLCLFSEVQLAGLGILQLSTPSHPTPSQFDVPLALTETKKTIHQWARDFSKTKFNSCSFGLVFFDRNRVQNLEGRQAFKMFRHRDKNYEVTSNDCSRPRSLQARSRSASKCQRSLLSAHAH